MISQKRKYDASKNLYNNYINFAELLNNNTLLNLYNKDLVLLLKFAKLVLQFLININKHIKTREKAP